MAPNDPHPSETPRPGGGPTANKRRGRPPGSISLTAEQEERIVAFVRAGAFLSIAAQAAGIAPRTLFDYLNRVESNDAARPATRRLRRFVGRLRNAQAEARIDAEVRVHRSNPALWLKYAARSKDDIDGWSEPPKVDSKEPTMLERWIEELDAEEPDDRAPDDR